jgi:phosphoenolpyruvate carboxylase
LTDRRIFALLPAQRGRPQVERVRRNIHLSINGLAAGLRNTG